ncbi:MAG: RagB/SusD family nutrient uptake outer membrane protein [Niabella sp.]
MKQLIYINLLLMALLMQSCSLDETIVDKPTAETVTTEGDVTAVIYGLYARFNDAGLFKFQGHIMLTVCADDFFSNSASEYGPYAQRVLTAVNTSSMWDGLYYTIENANNLMDVLDNLELSDDFEQRAYGEAYFIRAFCYYYLVRLYGGVPLRITAATIESDFYLPRASLADTYAQIFSDFNAAAERLPLKSDLTVSDLGRATKGAAQALLAQAYLTYADQLLLSGADGSAYFENAAAYADSVISSGEYSLISNYADLFDIAKETQAYNEVIFGIRFQTDGTARAQPAAGSEYALRFNAPNTYYVSANGDNQNGDGTYRVMPWFADYYRTGDYISDTVLDYRNEGAFWQNCTGPSSRTYYVYPNVVPTGAGNYTIPTPMCRKYIDPNGKDSRNHGNDFFIIRLAEIYYIKAEALNELNGGPTDEALAAFNTVRARARNADGVTRSVPADLTSATAGSQSDFRMKIFDDRGLELVGEGQRWFDLVRMPSPLGNSVTMYEYQFLYRLNNQLSGYPAYTTFTTTYPSYDNTTQTWSPQYGVFAYTLNVSVPQFLLFPVPTTELVQNPNFGSQNEGW